MATVFKRTKSKGAKWYIQWYDHTGKRCTMCSGTTDKEAAKRIANKKEADTALRKEGVIDVDIERVARASRQNIDELLDGFEDLLRSSNRSEKHIVSTVNSIRFVLGRCSFRTSSDINADEVRSLASELVSDGKSLRTVQAKLAAIKSFTKWLANEQKLSRDPLASVRKPNPKADRRYIRRMFLPDEFQTLRRETLGGSYSYRMTGDQRALLYTLAIETGLRAGELRSMTWENVYLDEAKPCVVVDAGATKNRRTARQYISRQTAGELRRMRSDALSRDPVFPMPRDYELARMLREDLKSARKAWLEEASDNEEERKWREASDFLKHRDISGKVLDFHSLRHTCAAWLTKSNMRVSEVQSVMRHSTVTLTADTYGHLFPGDGEDAPIRLRAFMEDSVALHLAQQLMPNSP